MFLIAVWIHDRRAAALLTCPFPLHYLFDSMCNTVLSNRWQATFRSNCMYPKLKDTRLVVLPFLSVSRFIIAALVLLHIKSYWYFCWQLIPNYGLIYGTFLNWQVIANVFSFNHSFCTTTNCQVLVSKNQNL